MKQETLFPKAEIPRATFIKRMHVVDAGDSGLKDYPFWYRFQCSHCGQSEEGAYGDITITEAKRGLPCPKCNNQI